MAAAPSSSSSGGNWKYDVFINFRGEDTRRGFVCHLYKDLKRKALDTFIDSEELRKGDDLSELLKAIQGSRLSLVVFSENYASSTWCLKELVQILKCMDNPNQNQIVVPIFYQVDPSHIRKPKASFGEALAKHERDSAADMEEIESWKSSLIRATNLSGWDSKKFRDDAKLIDDIAEDIFNKLSHISAIRDDGLVGMDSHISEMEMLLCPGMADVRFVGIWGMGGLGKTTIATAIYNKIDGQFDHCCFLENIKERFCASNGDIHMQEELLSRMLKEERQILGTLDKGLKMIRERLGKKKVLLVLDDVDHLDQIETLIGKKPSFGGGSRIIITTRDKHLLGGFQIYSPKLLSDAKALELFRQYAFRNNEPSLSYSHLSRRAIECAHGLPLALKVLGAFLDNKNPREWEDQLEKIKRIPDPGIQGVLRTSFDGLDDSQKSIFLDIACFFRGKHKDFVTKFLDSCGFFPHSGLGVLVDRALITITPFDDRLEMHDLLQEMGRDIVNRDPRGRSRLWTYEDVHSVLSQNTLVVQDTGAVEGIVLNLSEWEEVYVNTEAFVSMKKLRMLKLDDNIIDYGWESGNIVFCKQHVSGDLKFLSGELRFLEWHGCPLKSLPSNFNPKNLVQLDMLYSDIEQLWEGTKPLQKLVHINLRGSQYLTKTPDLTEATNLEKLNLQSCASLVEVHPSISALKNLVYLNLHGCKELKIFPSFIDMKSLEELNLSGCSKLEKFRLEFSENMKELKHLLLDETTITEVTSSINNHLGLQTLSLRGCRELRSLPSSIQLESLLHLDLSGCSNLDELPEISGDIKELSRLYLDGTAVKELPSSIEFLQGIETLTMRNCVRLVRLPDNISKLARLKKLRLDGCSKLSNLPENLGDLEHLYDLRVERSGIQQLPFSILRLRNLQYSLLSCEGCKEMTAPFSSWPTWMQENPSHTVLVALDLSDCTLFELTDAIAHLSSLQSLKLCRNNKLESLPAAMNRLVRLTYLHLDGCKRLKSIPELSSSIQFIAAHDCTALKTVSTPKPPYLKEFFNCFLFYNCVQLVQTNLFTDIVETTTYNQANYHPGDLFVSLPAGSDIPDWFNHQCRGSSVTVKLPPNWFPDKLLGLAICAISNLRGADNSTTLGSAICWCTFKENDGDDQKNFYFPLVECLGKTNKLLKSNHMFLGYKNSSSLGEWHNEDKYTEARFRIVTRSWGRLEDCSWITSCGVRLFHVNNEDSFSVDLYDSERRKRATLEREKETMAVQEEGEECPKGLLCSSFPSSGCNISLKKRRRQRERVGVTGATGSGCLGGRETPHITPLGSYKREGNMEQNDAFQDQIDHFREENKKSIVTFEHQNHKNQTLEIEHNSTPEFWPRNQKVNFRPKKSTEINQVHIVKSEIKPEGTIFQYIHEPPKQARRSLFHWLKYFGGNLKFKFKIRDKTFHT